MLKSTIRRLVLWAVPEARPVKREVIVIGDSWNTSTPRQRARDVRRRTEDK